MERAVTTRIRWRRRPKIGFGPVVAARPRVGSPRRLCAAARPHTALWQVWTEVDRSSIARALQLASELPRCSATSSSHAGLRGTVAACGGYIPRPVGTTARCAREAGVTKPPQSMPNPSPRWPYLRHAAQRTPICPTHGCRWLARSRSLAAQGRANCQASG